MTFNNSTKESLYSTKDISIVYEQYKLILFSVKDETDIIIYTIIGIFLELESLKLLLA